MGKTVFKEGSFEICENEQGFVLYTDNNHIAVFGTMWAAVAYIENEWTDLPTE